MGILDKLEGAIERATQLVVARTFRAEVQPVEIASAMRRAMDDKATRTSKGRSIVPNVYTIELSETDFERLAGWGDDLDDELIAAAEEHCDTQGYAPGGPLQINLVEDATLETGIFRLRPSTARSVRTSAADDAGQDAPGTPDPDQIAAFEAESTAAAGPNVPDPADIVESRAAPAPPAPPPVPVDSPPPAPRPRRVDPAQRPWLEIDGERYILMGAITVLGRDDSIDIILDDPGVSRAHSEFRVTTDGPHTRVAVRDLGSTNGTFVNGERTTSTHLEEGDRITMGRTSAIFHAGKR